MPKTTHTPNRQKRKRVNPPAKAISDEEFVAGFFELVGAVAGNRSWNVAEAKKAGLIARWLVGAEDAEPVSFYDEHLVHRAFALYCLKTNIGEAKRFAGQDQVWYPRYLKDFVGLWGGRDWRGRLPQWRQRAE